MTRFGFAPASLLALFAISSSTFLAALLMFHTSAGYFPVPALKFRSPRRVFCGAPFTMSVFDCSGNDVGMPELR